MISQYQKNATNTEDTVETYPAQQRVYISGFKHTHNLTVGVAYFYRGHYLYAYPQRNPIEPIAFSTKKKGIRILGITNDQAPKYDPEDTQLGYERSVSALEKSCIHEWEIQQAQEEKIRQEKMAGNTYTPHGRSQYLAYSAPGSRVGSRVSLQELALLAPQSDGPSVAHQGRSQEGAV
ncbi:hypothetical protein yc1106_01246 [Curvularia clavata]|uniref:Uncharacterized protein n=1 Tax=Curvularia clavata TaxID=95742 RepID=A0A9Q9DNY2_CURCL|nr:hypothetical protein yc1106_01246 [Curvularia clavata]